MMRNGHWLRGNSRTMIPKNHVLISTKLTDKTAVEGANALESFCVMHCRWQDSGLLEGEFNCGSVGNDAWGCMQHWLHEKETTIIWLDCPRENLPALTFTDVVEWGYFARKYWVWADPPVIIAGLLFGCRVKFLGVQNWVEDYQPPDGTAWERYKHLHSAVEKILQLVRREDLGHFRSTVAGQSMQAYRHLSLPGKIGIHNNRAALALERECPIGHPVRQRAWGKTPGPVFVLDVNALFPHCMGNYPYPRKLLWHTDKITVDELRRSIVHELVVARVSGYSQGEEFLVRRKEGAVFVHQLDRDTLCGPDLDRAFVDANLWYVHEACAYEGAGIFAAWSDWSHRLRTRYRERGDDQDYSVAKALTTRLWSQFAQRLNRWVAYPDSPVPPQPYGEFWHHDLEGHDYLCRAIANVVDRMEALEEPDDSFPAISAFVAAYSRDYVRRLCHVAGWENVLYVVADALHVSMEGFRRLNGFGIIHETRPGALKIKKRVEEATYLAANVNVLDGVLTQAGLPQFAREWPPGTWTWYSTNPLATEILRAPDGAVHQEWHHATTPEVLVPN